MGEFIQGWCVIQNEGDLKTSFVSLKGKGDESFEKRNEQMEEIEEVEIKGL